MEIETTNLHHAYFLQGEQKEAQNFLDSLFVRLGIVTSNNPDIHIYSGETFGIEEARVLKQRSESKAFGKKKFFIIYSPLLTIEAQNALLKVFEEPTSDTHFFIVSSKNTLVPTLLSRLNLLRLDRADLPNTRAKEFLRGTSIERMEIVKKEMTNENFNPASFLDDLLKECSKKPENLSETKKIYELVTFSGDKALNARLILEHLALTLKERLE